MNLKFDTSVDEIWVSKEPEATTKILPFPKTEVVGKNVHVCFDVEGGQNLMKGFIDAYDDVSGKFHISFFDGDEIYTDLVSDGDTVLWETGDITMDALWPSATRVKKEPANKAKNVDPKAADDAKDLCEMQVDKMDDVGVKENVVEAKKKVKPEADGMENDKDNQSEEIEIDDKDEETESAEVLVKPPKNCIVDVPAGENAESKVHSVTKPTSSAKKSRDQDKKQKNVTIGRVFQALGKKRVFAARDDSNKKPKIVNPSVTKAPQEKIEPKIITEVGIPVAPQQPEQLETLDEFRNAINDAGHNLIKSLKELDQSLQKFSTLSDRMCEYKETGKATDLKESNILRTARGLLTHLLGAKSDKKEAGQIEGIWPMNDHVMKVIARFYDITSDLCTEAKFPMQPIGNALLSWKSPSGKPEQNMSMQSTPGRPGAQFGRLFDNERIQPNSSQKKPDEGISRLASALYANKTAPKGKSAGKAEHYDPFAGTGNSMRDESLRILAHSMISTATPLEIAVELEKYASSKYGKGEDGTMPEKYLEAVKAMWDYLSPESKHCRPILRLMIRERVLDPKDIITLSAEDLKKREAEFYSNIQSKEWLRESLLQD